jgi:hypothetical protein
MFGYLKNSLIPQRTTEDNHVQVIHHLGILAIPQGAKKVGTHADYHFLAVVRSVDCLYGRLGAGDVYLYHFLGNYSATRSQSLKGTQKSLRPFVSLSLCGKKITIPEELLF